VTNVPTLPTIPGCGRPAVRRIEAYTAADGIAHGSLDASVYVCADHVEPTRDALAAAGFTPYLVPQPGPMGDVKRCGDGMDATGPTIQFLTAPDRPSGVELAATVVADQALTADQRISILRGEVAAILTSQGAPVGTVAELLGITVAELATASVEHIRYVTADPTAQPGIDLPCPAWCDDHQVHPAPMAMTAHIRRFFEIERDGVTVLDVTVMRCDDHATGEQDTGITLDASGFNEITPDDARQIAGALVAAADLVDAR